MFLAVRPTPTSRQASSGDCHLKFHDYGDNLPFARPGLVVRHGRSSGRRDAAEVGLDRRGGGLVDCVQRVPHPCAQRQRPSLGSGPRSNRPPSLELPRPVGQSRTCRRPMTRRSGHSSVEHRPTATVPSVQTSACDDGQLIMPFLMNRVRDVPTVASAQDLSNILLEQANTRSEAPFTRRRDLHPTTPT